MANKLVIDESLFSENFGEEAAVSDMDFLLTEWEELLDYKLTPKEKGLFKGGYA